MRNEEFTIVGSIIVGITLALLAVAIACFYETDGSLSQVLATIAGVIPVSATLIVQYIGFQHDRKKSKEEKYENQFFTLIANLCNAKESLSFVSELDNRKYTGRDAFRVANDTLEHLHHIFCSKDFLFLDDNTYTQLIEEEKQAQSQAEAAAYAEEGYLFEEAKLKAKDAVLKYERCRSLCQSCNIDYAVWDRCQTLPDEEKHIYAMQCFLQVNSCYFPRVIGVCRALEAFICAHHVYKSQETYINIIRSFFDREDIDFLSRWSDYQVSTHQKNLRNLIKILK